MRKSRKTGFINFIKHNWTFLWLAIAVVAVLGTGTFAAYTSVSSVKRVVSIDAGTGLLFSSNYMTAYELNDTNWTSKIITFNSGSNPVISVSVCNYAQENITKVNNDRIDYTFKAFLVQKDGTPIMSDTEISVTDEDGNVSKIKGSALFEKFTLSVSGHDDSDEYVFTENGCIVEEQFLAGGAANKNVYEISMPKEYLNAVSVKVCAVPAEASQAATNSKQLARMLSAAVYTEKQATVWKGTFTDSKVPDTQQDLDGFNYEISGNGEGIVTLKWDSTKVEVSPWFLDDIADYITTEVAIDDTTKEKTVSFKVGTSEQTEKSYQLQFYRVVSENTDSSEMNVQDYVKCTFAAKEDE